MSTNKIQFDVQFVNGRGSATPSLDTFHQYRPTAKAIEAVVEWFIGHNIVCVDTGFGLTCAATGNQLAGAIGVLPCPISIGEELAIPSELKDKISVISVCGAPEHF